MIDLGILAVALAVDAAAACAGLGASQRTLRPVWTAAALFGAFQAGMAGAGWLGGAWIVRIASAWDHWIAFGLLAAIGGRTMWRAATGADDAEASEATLPVLLGLAVATSLDALAAGLTLPLLPVHGLVSAAVIGVVTAALAAAAGLAGRRLGGALGWRIEFVGGLVLVGLGVKILAQHLTGG